MLILKEKLDSEISLGYVKTHISLMKPNLSAKTFLNWDILENFQQDFVATECESWNCP